MLHLDCLPLTLVTEVVRAYIELLFTCLTRSWSKYCQIDLICQV
jgi:hypothetical protein